MTAGRFYFGKQASSVTENTLNPEAKGRTVSDSGGVARRVPGSSSPQASLSFVVNAGSIVW